MQNLITMGRIYSIKLENFEGPLDLLCHLIDKNKMDIYDINISEIADQYIDYINQMEKMNLDITSEFLVMSSTLLYLKSKHLLQKVESEEEEITANIIPEVYQKLLQTNAEKINENAANIEKIAITETFSVGDKVKDMYRALIKYKKFTFNKLFTLKKHSKNEVVTAFTGLLEMSRRNKVVTEQDELFGDIEVEKSKFHPKQIED